MNDINALLTPRAALELADKEALVLEWYLDSENVGTWALGVTDASGHKVLRYKDNPSTIERALEVSVWLMRTKYGPEVIDAFGAYRLSEAEFAAALSFHYNTGRIGSTDWVDLVKEGAMVQARRFLETHYLNGGDLKSRRKDEAALFFGRVWKSDGHVTICPVNKPSYKPSFARARRVDLRDDMAKAFAAR
ncbi:glycoside hydrolase family protein [Sphingomonas immobilis]|uniref:Lysozyme n=1 Tax=Sphingomonas immobilis TaxID=3063997 RepID=A0ABT8ZU25_9SPHN|nr:hypothetical protein [Sphingomonas sp. CA1-15]MDO7841064.1 hypothetical protein [Sphingomonas sp. CA1-15]